MRKVEHIVSIALGFEDSVFEYYYYYCDDVDSICYSIWFSFS